MATISVLIAAALAVSAQSGGRWTPVSFGGSDGDEKLFFVNRADIVRDGARLEMEMTMVREQPSENGVDRVVERSVVDCDARSSTTIDVRFLLPGDRLKYHVDGDGKAEKYAPGSAWAILLDTVCDGTWTSPDTASPRAVARTFFARKT